MVSLWERLAEEEEMLVDLGSDQTSLHNPFGGGYYPAQLTFEEAQKMIYSDPDKFKFVLEVCYAQSILNMDSMQRMRAREPTATRCSHQQTHCSRDEVLGLRQLIVCIPIHDE